MEIFTFTETIVHFPKIRLEGLALWLGQTWEVAAWEIAHLGSRHLGKYSWEVAN